MKSWGIRANTLFASLTPALLIALLLGAYHGYTRVQELESTLRERGLAIVRQLAPACEYGVYSGNQEVLFALANAAIEERDVRSVTILDAGERVLARSGPSANPPGAFVEERTGIRILHSQDQGALLFHAPIRSRPASLADFGEALALEDAFAEDRTRTLGSVQVELSRSATELERSQVVQHTVLLSLAVLVLSVLWGLGVSRRITDPILTLTRAVQRVERGELDTRVPVVSSSELRTLEQGFNMMAAANQSARDELQEQVEQATLELRETLDTLEMQNLELDLARKEALAASRVKSEFLANMSHELRTPLHAVLGYTRLLARTGLGPEQLEYTQTIRGSAESLLTLVDDILDFSRIEADRIDLDEVDYRIRDCIEDVVDLLAPGIREKGLELAYLVHSDVPATVRGDPSRLRQVLVNLVSNAVKFTAMGSITVRVARDEANAHPLVLRFTIADTGVGLADADRSQLFRPFNQIDGSRSRKYGGSGLGLAIAKRLVERMNGAIEIESLPGRGTTISFSIRCSGGESWSPCDPASLPLVGRVCVLYEAHPGLRLALHEALASWGLQVIECCEAPPGEDGRGNLVRPDLALVGLPARRDSGGDPSERLARLQATWNCPMLILTGVDHEGLASRPEAKPPSMCLPKPVRLSRLEREIGVLLGTRRQPSPPLPPPAVPRVYAGLRILLAEDNEVGRRLIRTLLEQRGATVVTALDGREALERIGAEAFDLVLMDVHMPGLDGADATALIRAAERDKKRTPIIGLSADVLPESRERCMKAGMDDYLYKPVDEAILYRSIEHWAWNALAVAASPPQLSPAASPPPPERDLAAALRSAGGNESLAAELLGMLVAELPGQLQTLDAALGNADLAQVAQVAHTMAGGAAYCGALALAAAARALEQTARAGRQSDCGPLLTATREEVERLKVWMHNN